MQHHCTKMGHLARLDSHKWDYVVSVLHAHTPLHTHPPACSAVWKESYTLMLERQGGSNYSGNMEKPLSQRNSKGFEMCPSGYTHDPKQDREACSCKSRSRINPSGCKDFFESRILNKKHIFYELFSANCHITTRLRSLYPAWYHERDWMYSTRWGLPDSPQLFVWWWY